MAINIFRPEEKLKGSANYNSWKARLTAILEENDLDDIVFNIIEEPTSNAGRFAFKKKQAKARRIIYDCQGNFDAHHHIIEDCQRML